MQDSMWKKLLATIFSMMLAALLCATGFYTVRAEENISPAMVYDFSVITQKEEYSVDQAGNTGKQGSVPGTDGLNKAYLFNVTLPSVVGQGPMKFAFFTTDAGGFWSENGKILFVHNEYITLRGGMEEELAGEPNNNCSYNFSANGGALAPSATLKIEVGVQTVYENETHTANRYYVKYNDTEIISYVDTSKIVPGTGFHGPEIDARDNGNAVKLSSTLTDSQEAVTELDYYDVTGSAGDQFTTVNESRALGSFDLSKGNIKFNMNITMPSAANADWVKFGIFTNESGDLWGGIPGYAVKILNSTAETPAGGCVLISYFDDTPIASKDITLTAEQTYKFTFGLTQRLSGGEPAGQKLSVWVNDALLYDCYTNMQLGAYLRSPYLENENKACSFSSVDTITEGTVQTEYTMSDVGESGLAEYTQTGTTPIIGTLDAAPAGNVSYTHQLIIPEGFTLNGENSIKYGVFVTLTGAQIWDMPENTGIVVNICGDFMQIIGGADASVWADYEKDGAFVPGQTYEMKFTAVDLLRNGEKIGTIVRIYVNDEEVFEKQLGTEYALGTTFTGPYLSGGASCAFADEDAQVVEIEYDEVTGVTFEGPKYVLSGGSAQITVGLQPGYRLTALTANSADVMQNFADGVLTLNQIAENTVVSGTAEYVTYKVGFEENENAAISVNKTEFELGSDDTVIFTVTPDEGYSVTGLFIGETDYIASAQRNGNVWTLQLGGIEEDITLRAVCAKSVYTMSETSEHGTVTFSAQTVEHGGSVTVTVTADNGWQVSSVRVNGQEQTLENGSFTIENVTSDINIEAVFAEVPQMGGCSGSAGMAGGAAGIAAVVLAAVCLILIKGRKKV